MTLKYESETEAFAKRIEAMGFIVYIARQGPYGFVTDATQTRVLSFSFTDGGRLGGNYLPPSTTSGTGWRMDLRPHHLTTPEQVRDALYGLPPGWVGKGWRYLSTVAQYLERYDESSHFVRYLGENK